MRQDKVIPRTAEGEGCREGKCPKLIGFSLSLVSQFREKGKDSSDEEEERKEERERGEGRRKRIFFSVEGKKKEHLSDSRAGAICMRPYMAWV